MELHFNIGLNTLIPEIQITIFIHLMTNQISQL